LLEDNLLVFFVALVISQAFQAMVKAFVDAFITPAISMLGKESLSNGTTLKQLYFTANGALFYYGPFVTSAIVFFAECIIVYFFVVVPINLLMAMRHPNQIRTRLCRECLMDDIPEKAVRCKHCCTPLAPIVEGEDDEVFVRTKSMQFSVGSSLRQGNNLNAGNP